MGGGGPNNLVQQGFRGRFDDGVESLQESDGGATWIAGLNSDWSQVPNATFRMRILVEHPKVISAFDNFITMTYSHNGAPFKAINNTSLVVRLTDTMHWVHADESTEFVGRLGTGNWDDTQGDDGALMDDETEDRPVFRFTGLADVQTEIETEWSLALRGEDVDPGDTIDFRCVVFFQLALFTRGYTFTPRLTVVEVPAGATIRLLDDDRAPSASIGSDRVLSARVANTMAASASIDSFPSATARRVTEKLLMSLNLEQPND